MKKDDLETEGKLQGCATKNQKLWVKIQMRIS